MVSIVKAQEQDAELLAGIGKKTFIESHGASASADDINVYVNEKYSQDALKKELENPANIYHIIYQHQQPVGFSKIIFDIPYPGGQLRNTTKLERIYVLQEFYGMQLGPALLNFNIALSKENKQAAIWLYTWKENNRAINFYKKNGFVITGSYDFKISANHSNPNYRMLLTY